MRPGQLLAFGAVGTLAFVVDAGVLHLAILGGLGLLFGRLVSYLCAVTVSWECNRRFTFSQTATRATFNSWLRFAVSQLGGATLNIGTYLLLIHLSRTVEHFPVIGVAAGSLAGTLVNFGLARTYVFRGRPAAPPIASASARELAVWALLVPVFIWPAIYNGQPVYFYDTISYVKRTDRAVTALLHHRSHWSSPHQAAASTAPAPSAAQIRAALAWDKIVTAGRSFFYGVLLYAGDLLGGFWLTVVLQAIAVVAALALLLEALRLPRVATLPIGVALALLSSLPFYVSFLMPDIFTGVVIAGSAVLLTRTAHLSRGQLAAWWVLLSASALFHDTNLLILGAVLAAALPVRGLTDSGARTPGMVVVLLAIMTGVLGQTAFALGIKHSVGAFPVRPPFLTARLIDDGPALRYLRATCPGNGLRVCRFLDQLPVPADDFLWPNRTGGGIWSMAPAEDKRRLSSEELRLAGAVLAFDPLGQLSASLRDAGHQLTSIGLWEASYREQEKKSLDQRLPPDLLQRLHGSAAYQGRMPIATFEWILIVTFYGSICFVAATLLWGATRRALQPAVISVAVWMLVGVVVNAVVCGVISGPHERYSTRVQWLLALAALLILTALLAHRARHSGPQSALLRLRLERPGAHRDGQVSEPFRFGPAAAHGIEDEPALEAHEAEKRDRGG